MKLPYLILFALSLTACSADDAPSNGEAENARLFDAQRDALDKARQVEGMLQEAQQQHEQAIEAQTRQ